MLTDGKYVGSPIPAQKLVPVYKPANAIKADHLEARIDNFFKKQIKEVQAEIAEMSPMPSFSTCIIGLTLFAAATSPVILLIALKAIPIILGICIEGFIALEALICIKVCINAGSKSPTSSLKNLNRALADKHYRKYLTENIDRNNVADEKNLVKQIKTLTEEWNNSPDLRKSVRNSLES